MTDRIWEKFSVNLKRFISSRVSNEDSTKEILQTVFLKIHQNINTLKNIDKLESWIYQITRNTIKDYYRSKTKRPLDYFQFQSEDQNDDSQDIIKCLIPFIQNLSVSDQDILTKVQLESMSQKEYAFKYNLNYSTVKSRLQRARNKLKNQFIECCEIKSDNYGNILSLKRESCSC